MPPVKIACTGNLLSGKKHNFQLAWWDVCNGYFYKISSMPLSFYSILKKINMKSTIVIVIDTHECIFYLYNLNLGN